MIKGVLFDFDGVVVDSMQQHFQGWKKVLADYGHDLQAGDFFIYEGAGVPNIARYISRKFDLGLEDHLPEITEKVRSQYRHNKVLFFDGFWQVITLLKQKQLPLGVVTGGSSRRVLATIAGHMEGVFDAVVTLEDVRHSKPHPDPYLRGARKLARDPRECLVIENAPLGITAARAAGCRVLAVQTTLPAEALKEADFVVADFKEMQNLLREII